jgi:predicted DNA-binding protein
VVRTQIQLTDEQLQGLKQLSAAQGRSLADLVRDGVDRVLRQRESSSRGDLMRRAATAAFGRFGSGQADLARRHDDHFAEAAEGKRS